MTNGNDFAMPSFEANEGGLYSSGGLTKREHFAAMAMQGLLSDVRQVQEIANGPMSLQQVAVVFADALIEALNR